MKVNLVPILKEILLKIMSYRNKYVSREVGLIISEFGAPEGMEE